MRGSQLVQAMREFTLGSSGGKQFSTAIEGAGEQRQKAYSNGEPF
jgi:hypothetical protein